MQTFPSAVSYSKCHSLIASLQKHLLFVLGLPPANFMYCTSLFFFFLDGRVSNHLPIHLLPTSPTHDFTDLSTAFQTRGPSVFNHGSSLYRSCSTPLIILLIFLHIKFPYIMSEDGEIRQGNMLVVLCFFLYSFLIIPYISPDFWLPFKIVNLIFLTFPL